MTSLGQAGVTRDSQVYSFVGQPNVSTLRRTAHIRGEQENVGLWGTWQCGEIPPQHNETITVQFHTTDVEFADLQDLDSRL